MDRGVPSDQIERQQDPGGARDWVFFASPGCAPPSPSSWRSPCRLAGLSAYRHGQRHARFRYEQTSSRCTGRNAASRRCEEVLWDCRRHAEPDRPRHRSQRDRMGPYAARGGGSFRGGRRSSVHRPPHRLRRLVRPRQPPLHQRALRGQSQPGSGHPDRKPDNAQDLGFDSIQEVDFVECSKAAVSSARWS